ncbi:MAG: sel1 repeat family protein, partial [Synergistaceae bacterium]|nr:sel1 repeat family protein [Synergistaceae bacterium]
AKKEAKEKIKEIYAQRNAQIMELLTDSAYGGNVEAQKKLAEIYYNGDVDLGVKQDYRFAYIWYYVYGQRPGWHFFNDELNDIEGTGIFTFAKLSDAEIEKAKEEAQNIIKEIQVNLIEGNTRKITPQTTQADDTGNEASSSFSFKSFLVMFIVAFIIGFIGGATGLWPVAISAFVFDVILIIWALWLLFFG